MTFGVPQSVQLYKYTCMNCDTLLKETISHIDSSIFHSLKNEKDAPRAMHAACPPAIPREQ
jgi:hypothetical protein